MAYKPGYKKFIENYFNIVNKEQKIVPFKLNKAQVEYLRRGTGRDLILKPRQLGFSSLILAIFTVDFLTKDNSRNIIIADTTENASELLDKVKFYIESYEMKKSEELGRPFKVQFKYNSKNELYNEVIMSRYTIGTANKLTIGRSKTITNLHLSEAAYYPNLQAIMTGVVQAVVPDGRTIFETTANGFNEFKELWDRSEAGKSPYEPIFFPCSMFYSDNFLKIKRNELGRLFEQEYPNCLIAGTRVFTKGNTFVFGDKSQYKGKWDTYKVLTYNGYEVTGTENHKLFVNGKWKKIKDLKIGDEIDLLYPKYSGEYQTVNIDMSLPIVKSSILIDEEMAEFIGLFVGDGSLSKDKYSSNYTLSIVFDGKDVDVVEKYKKFFEKHFGRCGSRQVSSGGIELRVSSKYFRDIFFSLGLLRRRGSDGCLIRNVCIPEYIWKSPELVRAAFLRGLFDADGYIGYKKPTSRLFSKHEKFIKDVQVLLLTLGISSRVLIANKKTKTHTYIGRELQLRAKETVLFMKKIGFISKRKNNRWSGVVVKPKYDLIKKDRIVSIDYAGKQDVYDIEVVPHHFYCANGIKSHNSAETAFITSGNSIFDLNALKWHFEHSRDPLSENRGFRKYRPFNSGEFVVVAVDTAGGGGDYTAAQFLSKDKLDVPLVYQDKVSIVEATPLIYNALESVYRETGVSPVVSYERNNGGIYELERLKRLNKYNHYRIALMPTVGKVENKDPDKLGWLTNSTTRPKMLNDLKEAVNSKLITIYDRPTIKEMYSFIEKRVGSRWKAEAENGAHDDLVMSLAIAYQLFGSESRPLDDYEIESLIDQLPDEVI